MTYYIKLTVDSKEEKDVPQLTNELFKKLQDVGLTVTAVAISNGAPPTAEDELILEKGLQEEPAGEGGSTVDSTIKDADKQPVKAEEQKPYDPDEFEPAKVIYTQKPSSLTDDPSKHTWNFGTKWI